MLTFKALKIISHFGIGFLALGPNLSMKVGWISWWMVEIIGGEKDKYRITRMQ
jgi:hypothetical protein